MALGRFRFLLLLIIAALIVGWTHLTSITENPGLHYDEAWSANFAWRIASNENFLPVSAMSPQTSAWLHHYIAGGFQIFGKSLFVFRGLHIALSILGMLLISGAFLIWKDPKGAFFFLLLSGLTPALILNHRFAIELTSFHTLCFGAVIFGLSLFNQQTTELKKQCGAALIFGALFFGTTSHVLFVAISSALAAFLILNSSFNDKIRCLGIALGLLLLPFLIWMARSIPESGKAFALISLDGAWILWALFNPQLPAPWISRFKKALPILALPWVGILLFLMEGHWAIFFQQGGVPHPIWIGLWLLPVFGILWRTRCIDDPILNQMREGLILLLLCLAAVAPKPTGRYFECAFLLFLALIARSLSRLSSRARVSFGLTIALIGAIVFLENDLIPARQEQYQDRAFRWLIFHDDSKDFIPTQKLAQFLSKKGCGHSILQSSDSRLLESFSFLLPRYQDSCPWKKLTLQRVRDRSTHQKESTLWSEKGLELILPPGV